MAYGTLGSSRAWRTSSPQIHAATPSSGRKTALKINRRSQMPRGRSMSKFISAARVRRGAGVRVGRPNELGARSESYKPRRDPAQQGEPIEQQRRPRRPWPRFGGQRRADDPLLNEDLDALDDPRGRLATGLDGVEVFGGQSPAA